VLFDSKSHIVEITQNLNVDDKNIVAEDDCAQAAGIYQCAREKAPNVTTAIVNIAVNRQVKPEVFNLANLLATMYIVKFKKEKRFTSRSTNRPKILQTPRLTLHRRRGSRQFTYFTNSLI
jgi:hypothetical protein